MEKICLGIEGTAHTFGVGIVDENGKILADCRDTYVPPLGKGIIPLEARKHHESVAKKILEEASIKAGIRIEDIDLIAYSAGPGLPPPLLFIANFAKDLARRYSKDLIQVHHGIAHIEIGRLLTNCKDPVVVYLSGGHNAILAFREGKYRIFGETLDITVGNLFDTIARKMGLEMPGGPKIDKLAENGKYVKIPYSVKGMDVSFTGIQTTVIKLMKIGVRIEDIAYSLLETSFSMLTEVTERAIAHTEKNEVLLVGGVAASKRLQEMMGIMCKERGAKLFIVPKEYSGDNGVMIAWAGILAFKKRLKTFFGDLIKPKWRIDEIDWFI
ncbi:MAG: KEOPS complex N(6)-L-threonylcarbamoyladenine synthase Kae1 [Candidatus Aenigmatarchaeota archaeon]